MRCAVVCVVVVAACGLAGPAAAGDRTPVDLSALLEEVERASPQLLALDARVAASLEVASQREALPDPLLSAAYTNDGLSGFTLGSSEFTNLTVGWEQEVPEPEPCDDARRRGRSSGGGSRCGRRPTTVRAPPARPRHHALCGAVAARPHEGASRREPGALTTAAVAAQARYESGEGIQEG